MSDKTPCALCGTKTLHRIQGRAGCACVECLGEAAKQVITKTDSVEPPTITASHRCLLCGDPITKGNIIATRFNYVVCHPCLVDVLDTSAEDSGVMKQVAF